MSEQLLRFLQAGDFELDEPLRGMAEIPETLRSAMIDAPYMAAERVFDTAIDEQVGLVILTGNLFDCAVPAPRSLAFLRGQFQRLAEHRIPVYWSTPAEGDGGGWPASMALPDNVHCFSSSVVQAWPYEGWPGGRVSILGRGGTSDDAVHRAEFHADASGRFSIAVATGRADAQLAAAQGINHWALGGRADRKTLSTEPCVVHYAGSPQGRHPQSLGPHGCTLVEVELPQETRLRFIPCDALRWLHERVMISAQTAWEEATDLLAERVQEMRSQCPSRPLLVRWTLVAADATVDAGRLHELAQRAAKWLRGQYGTQADPCWPVSVDVERAEQISAASYEEDSLLGDYLRSIRQLRDDAQPLLLHRIIEERRDTADVDWIADLSDGTIRERVLHEAMELGAALLRGEDVGQAWR